jgi:RNA polymerase sigma factor (TIGR02999 family)
MEPSSIKSSAIKPPVDQSVSGRGEADQGFGVILDEIYSDLRRIAAYHFRRESPGHTLQPTAIVHEAYLRLVDQEPRKWENRAQFLGVASQMLRRVLIDHARAKNASKRGAGLKPVMLDEDAVFQVARPESFLAVCDALEHLKQLSPRQGQIVELRFFGGLTLQETAKTMKLSPSTIERSWNTARAWLRRELSREGLSE